MGPHVRQRLQQKRRQRCLHVLQTRGRNNARGKVGVKVVGHLVRRVFVYVYIFFKNSVTSELLRSLLFARRGTRLALRPLLLVLGLGLQVQPLNQLALRGYRAAFIKRTEWETVKCRAAPCSGRGGTWPG